MTHVAVGNVKKPFPEMKNCIYDFWQQLFTYPSVVHQFITFQGYVNDIFMRDFLLKLFFLRFIDWALDDKSEDNPEYEIRKRQIIHRIIELSENTKSAEVLKADPELIGRLKKYLQPAVAPAPRVEEMAL